MKASITTNSVFYWMQAPVVTRLEWAATCQTKALLSCDSVTSRRIWTNSVSDSDDNKNMRELQQ